MIGLVMATRLEAEPVISRLSLAETERRPFPVFRGDGVVLVLSGIGKARSAMAASYLIWKYGAGPLVNLGAAGSTGRNMRLGDVYLVDHITEYDRPALSKGSPRSLKPDVLEGFPTASLATQDHAVTDPDERSAVGLFAELLDMEAAAFVQACRLFDSRAYVFKVVSDTPDHQEDSEIVRNIRDTRDRLCDELAEKILPAVEREITGGGDSPPNRSASC